MGKLPVSRLTAGMKLGADLRNEKGVFLLPKGTVLSGAHIDNLRRWEVVAAEVEESQAPSPQAGMDGGQAPGGHARIAPEIVKAAKDHTLRRFARADLREEITREIFRLSAVNAARQYAKHGIPASGQSACAPGAGSRPSGQVEAPLPRMEDFIDVHAEFAALPDVLAKINAVVQDPSSTPEDAAAVIALDPGLSAKLLRLVNSSFYGFVAKVDTLTRAVAVIGNKQLVNLAMGMSVADMFHDVPPGLLNAQEFWKHSVACAVIAATLGAMIDAQAAERVFVAGLLHDAGRLVMVKARPDLFTQVLSRAAGHSLFLREAENEVLGFDHARLGAALLNAWRLPKILETAVLRHHHPDEKPSLESSLVHVADMLAHGLEYGCSAESLVPALEKRAWTRLGLPKEAIANAAQVAQARIADTLEAIFPEKGKTRGKAVH